MKLFYYKKTRAEQPDVVDFESFNIEKIIRTVIGEDGNTIVLLDDLHERDVMAPVYDKARTKIISYKKERDVYQSEIHLNPEDAERLKSALGIL